MIDCSEYVRVALYNQLFGDVTYSGQLVPIYKQLPFETTPEKYVVIGDITETQIEPNNNRFISNVDVNIDIYVEQYRCQDLSIIDGLATQILQVIFPSPIHDTIGDVSLAIYPIERTSSRYLTLQNGQNFVTRKILSLKFLVNQDQ